MKMDLALRVTVVTVVLPYFEKRSKLNSIFIYINIEVFLGVKIAYFEL